MEFIGYSKTLNYRSLCLCILMKNDRSQLLTAKTFFIFPVPLPNAA